MSVPGSGSSALRTARAAFWCSRCCAGCGRGAERLLEEGDARPPRPRRPRFSVAGVHGLPLTISANRASRTETTLPSWASPATAWSRNRSWSGVRSPGRRAARRTPGRTPPAPSGRGAGRTGRPRPSSRPRRRRTSSSRMKRRDRHPEVVPHQDDALHAAAVALPQGLRPARRSRSLALGVQPLLELVEDDQHLLPAGRPRPRRSGAAPRPGPGPAGSAGQRLPQPVQQPRLGLVGGRLDVDGDHVGSASRGSRPALTSDDLPQPDGP